MTALDTRIPAGLDRYGMTPDERRQYDMLQVHRALGLLIQRLPLDTPFNRWLFTEDGVTGTFSADAYLLRNPGLFADDIRALLRATAERLEGFEFTERPSGDGMNKAAVIGFINGVDVSLWVLLDPCTCSCGRGLAR